MATLQFMLLLCIGILGQSFAAVKKPLADYDLEELEDKLMEFDVDDDGRLTELEVELQQPSIQKYLDRFEELMKEAQKEDEEEEETGDEKRTETESAEKNKEQIVKSATQESFPERKLQNTEQEPDKSSTATSQNKIKDIYAEKPAAALNNEQEEDEDGVEIEVLDEMEYVTEEEEQTESGLSRPVVMGILAGVLSVVVTGLCMITRSAHNVKSQQREELMLQKREEWLKRVSPNNNPQAGKYAIPGRIQHISSKVSKTDTAPTSIMNCDVPNQEISHLTMSYSGESQNMAVLPESDNSVFKDKNKQPALNSSTADVSSMGFDGSLKNIPDCKRNAQQTESSAQVESHCTTDEVFVTDDSKLNTVSYDKIETLGVELTPQTESASSTVSIKSEKCDTENSSGDAKKTTVLSGERLSNMNNQSAELNVLSAPVEKTADPKKLKDFLEKVFSCTITLMDDLPRMRFSGGNMRIPKSAFPSTLEGLEEKVKSLARSAFDKQVNKVKVSINAFNVCESEREAFKDVTVEIAVAVVKKEAVVSVLNHFKEETKNSSHEHDDGLWGSESGSELYETYGFLPRLAGSASDNVNISSALLSELLENEIAGNMVSCLLHVGGHRLASVTRLDEMLLSECAVLQALDVLVQNTHFGDALGQILAKEKENAVVENLGNFFEKQTTLSALLNISTIPHSSTGRQDFQPPPASIVPFKTARSFPQLSMADIETAQKMIQKGIHKLQEIVYTAMRRVMSGKTTREAGLSWLATVITLNELRTSSVLQDNTGIQPVCSDGFMLNLCAVLLEFFLPISQSSEKLNKVDTGYSASQTCRLSYDFEACLAGGQIVCDRGQECKQKSEEVSQHSFITECYHLTQRALSITVVPAIKHFIKMMTHFSRMLEQVKGTNREEAVKAQHVLIAVVWETCLMDPELVHNITLFYISQAKLLLNIINPTQETCNTAEEAHKAQKKALSVIPEFCIKDMAQWFSFLANHVLRLHPNSTKGISLTPFVDCCVMLLERPDLMPGPVPASMIVSALLAFMKDPDSNSNHFGVSWGSGIMSDLAAMVHTCPTVQTKLGPALLRTYVSVDVVEGLDVDKDSFDKFSARIQIGQLVQKLWSRIDCRASIIKQCGTELFQNFLDSILDTLLYMLHDSLSRLANVKKIETLKENEQEWKSFSNREQAEKEAFLRNEESVGSGFMQQAKKTLSFLTLLSQSEKVAACFTRQPLATRAASTINGFLDSLCGAKAKLLKVKDMSKYEFNPIELLSDIIGILLRITEEDTSRVDGFLVSMVKDPDFEVANMEKAESVIFSKSCSSEETQKKVKSLMTCICQLAKEHGTVVQSASEDENNWRKAFIDLHVNRQELEQAYQSAMESRRFGEARISDSHCFLSNMNMALDARSPKVKTLLKEIKQLASSLPVQAEAGIFVRQDKDRIDVMRAMITGPTGTPYSLGCFCFDIYYPSSYPNVPPLVKIITTGNGTVRFNPNLYADGKVCLSLLGTWHAGDASEKWTPGKSSLYQVLLSIQSMILTPDPVFNEPGYERLRDTHEGEVQSRQYNWKLHLHTLRHAVLGQLKNPPPGFELLIRHHFALQREAILKQCAEWVQNCEDPDLLKRMCRTADAIFEELMCLDVDLNEQVEDSEEEEED